MLVLILVFASKLRFQLPCLIHQPQQNRDKLLYARTKTWDNLIDLHIWPTRTKLVCHHISLPSVSWMYPSNLSTGTWFFSIFECILISYRFCDFVSCCVCYVSLDLSGAVSVQCLTSILPFSWLLSHHHGSKNRFSNISRMPGKSRTLLELSNFKDTK